MGLRDSYPEMSARVTARITVALLPAPLLFYVSTWGPLMPKVGLVRP